MTTIELQARKAALIQNILNSVNTEAGVAKFEKLIQQFSRTEVPEPAVYTHEEKMARLAAAETSTIFYTEEEVDNMIESWYR